MPKYKQGMRVQIVQAECPSEGCDCGHEPERRRVVGEVGIIQEAHKAWMGNRNNPHHYSIRGGRISTFHLWCDVQIKRYHGGNHQNTN